MEPFGQATLEVQKKALVLLKVNAILVVALLISGIGINWLILPNPRTAILEIGAAFLLICTFVCVRTDHFTTAGNVTIGALLAGLGIAGFFGYSGDEILDYVLLSFNLVPVIFYACLIGTRQYQPVGAMVVCLGLNLAFFVVASNNQQWQIDFSLGALLVNSTIISLVSGAMAYHIMNMNRQLIRLAEEEAGKIRDKTDEIRRAEEWLRVTLHSIGDGVITTDMENHITMLNPVAERLTGWSAAQADGKTLDEIFHLVDEFTLQPRGNPARKVIEKNTIVKQTGYSMLISRDGAERVVTHSGAPIRDPQQNTIGVVLVFRDETEKRRVEDSLKNTERLESLGALAGGLAHDFNNLLCGLFGFIELAHLQADRPDKVRHWLDEATTVFDRARGLTRQLLTFAKGGAPERQATALDPLLRQSVAFALSGSNVAARFDIADDLWPCEVDRGQLSQAVGNLARNGQQAMANGGTLYIEAVNWPEGLPLPVGLPEGRYVKLSVRDTGTGVRPRDLPHIFDPFFTTKEQGNGLGLSMVRSVISQHGGNVDVETQHGRGATFILFFPASERAPDDETEMHLPEMKTGRVRVLLVDDEDTNLRVLTGLLQGLGYETAGARNQREATTAFQKAREKGAPFDVAILDLTIKGGPGGKEIVIDLRDEDPDLRVIATSGYSDDPIMANPSAYGFHDRLHKPFRRADLANVLARVLA